MTDLYTLTTSRRLDTHQLRWEVPDGWQQGRGAYGGLVLAALVRAIEAVAGSPERPLRSLNAELCGPTLPGESIIRVEVLREGSGVSTVAARLVQEDGLKSHAVAVLGRQRTTDCDWNHVFPPDMTPWREVPMFTLESPFAPPFARFFQYGPTGALPFSGQDEARSEGWIRPLEPCPVRDAAYLTALADSWWPSFANRFTAPRPMGTISFMLEIVDPMDGPDPAAPLYHRGNTIVVRDGYAIELRELWGEDGRLLTLNQQVLALIR